MNLDIKKVHDSLKFQIKFSSRKVTSLFKYKFNCEMQSCKDSYHFKSQQLVLIFQHLILQSANKIVDEGRTKNSHMLKKIIIQNHIVRLGSYISHMPFPVLHLH